MITNITLENFKCFRKVEVNPRRITVFIGPNGTGKSSVLQAMALLEQSPNQNRLNLQGPLVNLRSYSELQSFFAPERDWLRLAFSGSYEIPQFLEGFDQSIHYSVDLDLRNGIVVSKFGGISFKYLGVMYSLEHERETDLTEVSVTTPEGTILATRAGDRFPILSVSGTTGVTKAGITQLIDILRDSLNTPARTIQRLRFVPAARGLVRPTYRQQDRLVDDISMAEGLSQQEEFMASNLGYTRSMESKLSGQLKQITGVGLRADPIPPQSVSVNSVTPNGDVNIVSEGFGTNALIQLFWQLDRAEKGATVMIEEPEIHLHPKAQAELASLLVEEAQAEDKQIIMTTHSEHILHRLLTLVAEDKLGVDELAVYAFEKDEKGECTAHQLEVTDDGKVMGGIRDFFETHLDELNRYIGLTCKGR